MGESICLQILLSLQERHKSGSAEIKSDVELAQELRQTVTEIQIHLDILEDQKLVTLYKSFGPSYGATITPHGLLFIKQVEKQVKEHKRKRPIGFRPPRDG
jgi:dihydroorotase